LGLVVQTIALPPPLVAVRVTLVVLPVTTFPPASSIETEGCVANAVPPVAVAEGAVVNANCAAAPTETVTGAVVLVRVPSVAVIV
jgi:hypothetical protein